MSTTEVLQFLAPLISSLALIFALLSWKDKKQISILSHHYNYVTEADNILSKSPNCLRFHGINADTIKKEYGVDPSELAYLLQIFNAGSITYLVSNPYLVSDSYLVFNKKHKKRHEDDSYWYRILKNEETQNAFRLIKQLFDPTNPFIARCQTTITFHKKVNPNNTNGKDR